VFDAGLDMSHRVSPSSRAPETGGEVDEGATGVCRQVLPYGQRKASLELRSTALLAAQHVGGADVIEGVHERTGGSESLGQVDRSLAEDERRLGILVSRGARQHAVRAGQLGPGG